MKRYRAVIFFPGPKTCWSRTSAAIPDSAENDQAAAAVQTLLGVQILKGIKTPDPSEILMSREYRWQVMAFAFCRAWLRRLSNVRAEIHQL